MFKLNSIRKKLMLLSISLLIIPGLIIGIAAFISSKDNLNKAGEDKLKNGVKMGLLIIDSLNQEVESGNLTLEEAQEQAREYLIGPKKADGIREFTNEIDLGENGYFSGYDEEGNDVIHYSDEGDNSWDTTDKNGHLFVQEQIKNGQSGGGFTTYIWTLPNSESLGEKISYTELDPNWGWVLAAGTYKVDFNAGANQVLVIISITLGFAVIIGGIISTLFTNSLTRPIRLLTTSVKSLAGGDLTVEKLNTRNKDEIGTLSRDFNMMVGNLTGLIQTMQQSILQINASSQNLSAISEETSATGQEISAGIYEIARGATKQAEDSEIANSKVNAFSDQIDTVRQQTEIMISKSEMTSDASNQGLQSVNLLRSKSEEANKLTQTVSTVMDSLAEKVKNIESIMSVINEISEQTNLLALNASIEAARAGEHGKGFAVVADEVRKLAEQSSQATGEVQQTLDGIIGESNNATNAMKLNECITEEQMAAVIDTEKTFHLIATSIEDIVSSIEGIGHGVQEMSAHRGGVLESIESIAAVSQQAAASTEEVTAAMEEQVRAIVTVADAAEELSHAGEELEKEVSKFHI